MFWRLYEGGTTNAFVPYECVLFVFLPEPEFEQSEGNQ